MNVKLVAYGIAKEILGGSTLVYPCEGQTIAALKQSLEADYPAFAKLRSLDFAINEDYQADSYVIQPGDEVVIIPPVSGG